ncbi:MAG TPA: alkaline phosphatase family protein, partial [Pseudonocardiaceae bacterium]|nr:alkaline phosphatase family protein [Pseudonocardiaceae bacterium]
MPAAPRYGVRSLPDVLPSLLAALGVPGVGGPLPVPPARSACVLLLDGLGWELLREHHAEAPFLAGMAQGTEPLDAGFPATTATSIASLGTGRPSGEHGIVGYLCRAHRRRAHRRRAQRAELALARRSGPDRAGVTRGAAAEPHDAAASGGAGLAVRVVAPAAHRRSGLTRAALRGGEYRGVYALGDLAAEVLVALQGRALCYAYFADLDTVGHRYGPGSVAWRLQLAHLDRLVAAIVPRLPPDALLCVVADHGMVPVRSPVDADADPRLREGVTEIAG